MTNIAAMGLRAVYWAQLWRNSAFYLNPTHKRPKTNKYKSIFQQLVLGVSCYGEMILVFEVLRNLLLRLLPKSQWSGAEQYLLCYAPCIEKLRFKDSTTQTVSAWPTELTLTWWKQYSQTSNIKNDAAVTLSVQQFHMYIDVHSHWQQNKTFTTEIQPSSSSLNTY